VEIHLTQPEFALLEYLVRNVGRVVTRTMLLDHLCKARIGNSTNIVDVHVHRLQEKLDKHAQRPLIRTIRGVGYILTE
jgi:DNA-binding response OmpR family regulator